MTRPEDGPGSHAPRGGEGERSRRPQRLTLVALCGALLLLFGAAPAGAQPLGEGAAAFGARVDTSSRAARRPRPPRVDPRLAAGDEWPAGRVDEQLDEDPTLVPFGKGAIFVPAMTAGLDEPPVEILKGDERVAEGTSGQRILLVPGTYSVRIGSGASQQRMKVQATVKELATTVIPVSWSALTVHVVDENYGSLRASYELIRVSDREYMGIGFGTDEQAGEPISTWVLRPGLYKIVRVGENYRARRDFVTVRLVRGKHTHFLLVLDEETGEFEGGGEVPAEELFRPQDGFFGSLVIGGDVTMNIRNNILGFENGVSLAGRGFIDGRLAAKIFDNPLILQLQVEQGLTNLPDAPIQKTIDRVDLDVLYLYRVEPWIGPYARIGGETNLFPGERNFTEPRIPVRIEGGDISVGGRAPGAPASQAQRVDSFALSPAFGRIRVREGVGINVRAFKSVSAELNLRAGFGARHLITDELYDTLDRDDFIGRGFCDGVDPPPGVVLTNACRDIRGARELEDAGYAIFEQRRGFDRVGVDLAILATARLTRYVLVNLEFDNLISWPLERSIIDAEGSVALKLTSFVSVNYVVRYLYDQNASIVNPERIEQNILLRFSVDLL